MGSVSPNTYLQILCVLCIRDGRQVVNQTCFMDIFLGNSSTPLLSPSRPWDEYTGSRFSFSQLAEMIHTDFQGLPLSYTIIVSLVWNAWQPYQTMLIITGSMCEFLPLTYSLLECSGEGPAFISPLAAHSTVIFSFQVIETQIFEDVGLRTAGSMGKSCLPPHPCLGLLPVLPNIPPSSIQNPNFGDFGATTTLAASCHKRAIEHSLGSVCLLTISQRRWTEVSSHRPVIDVQRLRSQRSTVLCEDHL